MPRDATLTRAKILDQAERLFATRGVYQATVREITVAAGQRNSSALNYHFGSREGVLFAILAKHAAPLDAERAELVQEPLSHMATRELVTALLVPYSRRLRTDEGRNYLRIVAQLTDLFPIWGVDTELNPPVQRAVLAELERRAGADVDVARERVIEMIMLLTTATAERARVVHEGLRPALDDARFLANLADTLVAILDAPAGPPLPR